MAPTLDTRHFPSLAKVWPERDAAAVSFDEIFASVTNLGRPPSMELCLQSADELFDEFSFGMETVLADPVARHTVFDVSSIFPDRYVPMVQHTGCLGANDFHAEPPLAIDGARTASPQAAASSASALA
jgi:hypothetical protein